MRLLLGRFCGKDISLGRVVRHKGETLEEMAARLWGMAKGYSRIYPVWAEKE